MRKILPIIVIGILVISGFGAFALNTDLKELDYVSIVNERLIDETLAFTHTVLGEYGSATWCGPCRHAHGALKELYAEGQLDFYYVSLVCDMNSVANNRKNEYNLHAYPTLWWDGGYDVDVGAGSVPGAKATYTNSINSCGSRTIYDINIDLTATWLGGTNMEIECTVYNNEPNTYGGTIRVYITDITSSEGWTDSGGKLYTFAFLDWAFNEAISIPASGSWSDSMTWDGSSHGYSSVTEDNTMIIASVFNDTWHQGYSDPPDGNPFSAYYVDETVGFRVGNNRAPYEPSNPVPSNGATDVSITPTLSWDGGDPDWFDDVYYDVYFEKDDPTPDVLVSNDQTVTTYEPGTLELDSTYYWQIISEDEHGASTTGPVWSFTTRDNDPPYTPSNPDPADGATDVSLYTDLNWDGGDPDGDSVTYDVYFGDSSPPPLVSPGQSSTYYYPGTLELFTTYYWQIVAEDSFGETTSGPIWHFTTQEEQNNPPGAPTITGETNGKIGVEYEYTFNAEDSNGDGVMYHIDWDDGNSETTGVNPPGVDVKVKHSWNNKGTYTIRAYAEDEFGLASPEGTLTITIRKGKNRAITSPFQWFLQQHPNLFPFLRLLLLR